jgi:multidrug efflux pump subunit AcrA (membrane-fusion protein)
MRSARQLHRLLAIAAAVVGVWFVFVTTGPAVVNHLTKQQSMPQLTTAELRSFPALATASGVLQLANGTTFVLRSSIKQAEEVVLKAGLPATVTVDALPGLVFPGKVSSIETSATQVGGVPEYYAEVALSASDPRLRNGQTGSVKFRIADVNNVLSILSTALFIGVNNRLQVDVWSTGQAHATTVTIGLVGKNLTQITSGLQVGEQLMLAPAGQTLPSSPSPT